MKDASNGYEAISTTFIDRREKSNIGAASVRVWARLLPPRAAVLDLGCGSGVPISAVLIEEGLAVHGVDASPGMVAAFRARFPGVPVVCESVEASSFFDRSFDAILAWGLLFLLPARTQISLLQRAAAVLNPGGRLLFTAPRQACEWKDNLTGHSSVSLGAPAYRTVLAEAGLSLAGEYEDEGGNHYYDSVRPELGRQTVRTRSTS